MEKLIHFVRKVHLFAAKGPAYHFTYGRWRLSNWLQKISDHSFDLDQVAFLTSVDLERSALLEVKKAATSRNDDDALVKLTNYFRVRSNPVFFFAWEDKQEIISLIGQDQKEATIRAADEICQNTYNFRGAGPVKFEDGIDWTYRPQGNIDWTWDLNRHAYFETLGRAYWYTGDERYARKFQELLLHWLANNQARAKQPNWSSVFEVAFRINTWAWAFYYFRVAPSFDHEVCLALLKGLLAHGRYLDTNLELQDPNNHLLLEAKALALLGILFPEFKEAKKWRQRGLSILYQQIQAQVWADGVHGEQATLYHRVITGGLLELLVLMGNNGIPLPPEIVEIFGRMVEFELWITKPNGLITLFGDSALADTYLRFSAASGGVAFLDRRDIKAIALPLDEATIWLLGPRRVRQYLASPTTAFCFNSRAFPEGGYFIMRAGQGSEAAYLAFDCGPFGYKPASGHGHADALSFELHALGQTLLVDPGVYSTFLGQDWRNFFRGSRAHNTVVVDNQDQSILLDRRRVYRPAQATLHQWLTDEQFDFVDGSHNGYERLSEPITHRRQVFFVKPEYWVVIDVLSGRGQHCFDLYFHLMPGVETYIDWPSKSLHTGNGTEPGLIIAPLVTSNLQAEIITGATAPIQGWVSFFSGEKQPAPTLRYCQEGVAPTQFCTVLYPYPAGRNASVNVSPLGLEVEGGLSADDSRLTSLCIETDRYLDYLVVDRGSEKTSKVFAEYESEAPLIYVRHKKQDNELVRVITGGGGQLLFQGQPLLETKNF